MKRVLAQSALWLAVTAAAYSQALTGEILGAVADASGASVAQAKVTVRNTQTNIESETTTSNEGSFRVLQLPIGVFEVTVEKQGFAKYVVPQVQLALNQKPSCAFRCKSPPRATQSPSSPNRRSSTPPTPRSPPTSKASAFPNCLCRPTATS